MHGNSVIPHGNITGLPLPAHLDFWPVHMIGKPCFQRIGFVCRQTYDMINKRFVKIKESLASNRMFLDKRANILPKADNSIV
jgi:hypothetical protein